MAVVMVTVALVVSAPALAQQVPETMVGYVASNTYTPP